MSELALAAAFRAVADRLGGGGYSWSSQVWRGHAPSGATYPYVIFFNSGGGEANVVRGRDAELMITVKVVSDQLAEAFAVASEFDGLLNDHGQQDNSSDYLVAGSVWNVLTVTGGETLHYTEWLGNADSIEHVGVRYRFKMEEA